MKFDILQHIGICTDDHQPKSKPKGYNLELNIVSWDGEDPEYDLRNWSPDHQRYLKGISLTRQEMDRMLQGYLRFVRNHRSPEEAFCVDNAILIDKNGVHMQIKLIAALSPSENGYTKMLTITSWNKGYPRYDIRSWSLDYRHMTAGMTLNREEMRRFMFVYKTWIEF